MFNRKSDKYGMHPDSKAPMLSGGDREHFMNCYQLIHHYMNVKFGNLANPLKTQRLPDDALNGLLTEQYRDNWASHQGGIVITVEEAMAAKNGEATATP